MDTLHDNQQSSCFWRVLWQYTSESVTYPTSISHSVWGIRPVSIKYSKYIKKIYIYIYIMVIAVMAISFIWQFSILKSFINICFVVSINMLNIIDSDLEIIFFTP